MKLFGLPFLLCAMSAGAAAIEKRQWQTGPLFGALGSLAMKPNKVWQAQPELRNNSKRTIARWGPFELPALNESAVGSQHGHLSGVGPMDPNGFLLSKMITDGICTDCTVLGGKADITYEDGTLAGIDNGVYLHHVLLMDPWKTPGDFAPWCPGNLSTMSKAQMGHPVKSIFLSGGVEHFKVLYTTPDGKFDSGYYVHQGPFAMTSEIVNYKTTPQKIFITFDYEWVPGKVGADALSTLLTITGCDINVGWYSDKPQNSKMSGEFPILSDGTIINTRGHMHDGGEKIILYLNNKPICTSVASYGGVAYAKADINGRTWETISKVSECAEPLEVKKGDYVKMEVFYDTAKHPLRESFGELMEEMGIYTFTFVPKKS